MTPSSGKLLPTYFISHGGGPWSYMDGAFRRSFDKLEASLQAMPRELGAKPKAILVVSGHWEEDEFTVMSSPRPPMVYDYSGFPRETYAIQYPASGDPELARRIQGLIVEAGFPARLDSERGFDHGTFAPLKAMYPDADVPVLQLSIRRDYDPEAHLRLGRALAPLRAQGVLIVGSGLSYHNLSQFGGGGAAKASRDFDAWLDETLNHSTPEERVRRLKEWERAPSARAAHPQEDHLIPLMVALGAAEREPSRWSYHEEGFMGALTVSSYCFG